MKSLDRAAVRVLLKRLADAPAPQGTARGAMCYVAAPPPHRADYVCPKCGERTVYDGSKATAETPYEREIPEIVEWEIPSCRRVFEELRKVAGDAMVFDESQFCRKCSPKVVLPKLVLHISYKGEKVREIEKIDGSDLRILTDFLSGKLLTESRGDETTPLKHDLPRLQELLGVTPHD